MELDKTPLVAAVAEYDRTEPSRQAMVEKAMSDADIAEFEAAYAAALIPVQEAYFQVTQGFNSRQHCALVQIEDARSLLKTVPKTKFHSVPIEQRIGGWASQ